MSLEQERREMYPAFQEALQAVKEHRFVPRFEENYLNKLVLAFEQGTSERQVCVCFNKWVHDFHEAGIDIDFALMVGEVSEALEARATCQGLETVRELADIVIYCYGIAQTLGYDLDSAIDHKMKEFRNRNYLKDEA